MNSSRDHASYYEILDVSSNASVEAIKSAYQHKARRLHPDKRKGSDGEAEPTEAFLCLQKAWECLRDPEKKKEYDMELFKSQKGEASKGIATDVDDWEPVEDGDTGDIGFIHTCRCGEDIWVTQEGFAEMKRKAVSPRPLIHCEGCSLVYYVALENDWKTAFPYAFNLLICQYGPKRKLGNDYLLHKSMDLDKKSLCHDN